MKRDLELIRKLLQILEHAGTSEHTLAESFGLSVSDPRVQYHMRLLVDAGYARSYCQTAEGHVCVRLTWQGHELLELCRNQAVWHRALQLVRQRTGALSLTSLHSLLSDWAREMVADCQHLLVVDDSSRQNGERRPNGRSPLADLPTPPRRFVPPPTVHPARSYPLRQLRRWEQSRPACDDSPAVEQAEDTSGSEEPDDRAAQSMFQFHVWSGHAESLPLYLL